MKCKLHPTYKGIRRPRIKPNLAMNSNCECWFIYMNAHSDKKYPNLISGKMMSLNDWRIAGREASKNLVDKLKK